MSWKLLGKHSRDSKCKEAESLNKSNGRANTHTIGDKIQCSSLDTTMISVVIPCYNQAHYLGEAIQSVLNQTYSHLEIIVVDDGSTDNTCGVAATYSVVRCIRQQNKGLSAARNSGLYSALGDYVVFLDADDRLLPHALEAGLNRLKAHPECAFVSGYYRYIREDGSFLKDPSQEYVERDHYAALLRGNYIGMHATVLYQRGALQSVGGFDTSLAACEDYDLYLRIARKFPIYCHTNVVCEYRQHDANMSGDAALMLKSSLAVLRSQRRYVKTEKKYKKAYNTGMKAWKQFYGSQLLNEVVLARAHGEEKQAIKKLLTLLRYAPHFFAVKSYKKVKQIGYSLLRAGLAFLFAACCFTARVSAPWSSV